MLSRKTTIPISVIAQSGSFSSAPEIQQKEVVQRAAINTVTVRSSGAATAYVTLAIEGMEGKQELTYDFQYSAELGDVFAQVENHLVNNEGYTR